MDLFPRDARVQTAACGALMNIAGAQGGKVMKRASHEWTRLRSDAHIAVSSELGVIGTRVSDRVCACACVLQETIVDSAGLERVYRALDVHSEDAVVQEVACACLSNCMSAPGAAKLSLPAGLSAILVRTHTLMCALGVRVVWIPRLCAHHTRCCPFSSSGRARVCPPVKSGQRPAVSCLQLMLTLCDLLCCAVHHGSPLLQRRHRRQRAEQPCVVVRHPRWPNRLYGGGWLDLSAGCHGLPDPHGEAEWAGEWHYRCGRCTHQLEHEHTQDTVTFHSHPTLHSPFPSTIDPSYAAFLHGSSRCLKSATMIAALQRPPPLC